MKTSIKLQDISARFQLSGIKVISAAEMKEWSRGSVDSHEVLVGETCEFGRDGVGLIIPAPNVPGHNHEATSHYVEIELSEDMARALAYAILSCAGK